MRLIYCGDVVARAGREAVLSNLPNLRENYKPDVIIVNIEMQRMGLAQARLSAASFLMPAWMLWLPETMCGNSGI